MLCALRIDLCVQLSSLGFWRRLKASSVPNSLQPERENRALILTQIWTMLDLWRRKEKIKRHSKHGLGLHQDFQEARPQQGGGDKEPYD